MHPIERLRYVARASGADQSALVRETAGSLGAFADDPAGLVMACRRMLARHLTSGPLWWLTSRACTSVDAHREAWAAADEFDADATARLLAYALPDDATVLVLGWPEVIGEALPARGDLDVLVVDTLGESAGLVRRLRRAAMEVADVPQAGLGAAAAAADLVLLEASVVGPDAFVAVSGSRAAAAVARHAGKPVWLVAGVGRLVPRRLWDVIDARLDAGDEPWDAEEEVVPLDLVTDVAGPVGMETPSVALKRVDTPIAPELLKEGVL
ncbi:MAG: hypothetical protein GEV08_10525 [Acidimicrobiia bacterium]|nr:hypothetical protein [Acidimicrobiia bacterium]